MGNKNRRLRPSAEVRNAEQKIGELIEKWEAEVTRLLRVSNRVKKLKGQILRAKARARRLRQQQLDALEAKQEGGAA